MEKPQIPKFRKLPYDEISIGGERLRVPAISSECWQIAQTIAAPSPETCRAMLLELRQKLGWTRSMLAVFLGVTARVLQTWELGSRKPSRPAKRLIWVCWSLMLHPRNLRKAANWFFWGDPQTWKEPKANPRKFPGGPGDHPGTSDTSRKRRKGGSRSIK